MEIDITIEKALELENKLFIDLRAPSEYQEAHIPGAVNIPLLENEERALVGTIYKKESPELATEKGFEIIAPKLPHIISSLKNYSKTNHIILYCWRGGMRSKALSQTFSILGGKHSRLIDGYHGFRRYVNDFFSNHYSQEIVVLHGLTGVGKTELLQQLKNDGFPAIDLEDLAQNRGSVFGQIGYKVTTGQKQFEGKLFLECYKYKNMSRIAVECESRRIGNVLIPPTFFQAMQSGKKILLYDSYTNRVKRLISTYAKHKTESSDNELKSALQSLKKRLGNEKVDNLIKLIDQSDYQSVTLDLLYNYYDPLYKYPSSPSPEFTLSLDAEKNKENLFLLKEILLST